MPAITPAQATPEMLANGSGSGELIKGSYLRELAAVTWHK